MSEIKGTPDGCEDSVEEGPTGWAVWKERTGRPPCPSCSAPYDKEDPAHALQCPDCYELGCDSCMPLGRGVPCVDCEFMSEEGG